MNPTYTNYTHAKHSHTMIKTIWTHYIDISNVNDRGVFNKKNSNIRRCNDGTFTNV